MFCTDATNSILHQLASRDHYQQIWSQLFRVYGIQRRLPPEAILADLVAMTSSSLAPDVLTSSSVSSSFGHGDITAASGFCLTETGSGKTTTGRPTSGLMHPSSPSLTMGCNSSIDSLRQKALEYAAAAAAAAASSGSTYMD